MSTWESAEVSEARKLCALLSVPHYACTIPVSGLVAAV